MIQTEKGGMEECLIKDLIITITKVPLVLSGLSLLSGNM